MKVSWVRSLLFPFLVLGFAFAVQDTVPGNPDIKDPAYVQPKLSETKSCDSAIHNFCSQLLSSAHSGKLDVWVAHQNYKVKLNSDTTTAVLRAQVESLRAGQAPADFLKNLERSYLVGMEKALDRAPSSEDPERQNLKLKEQYKRAFQATVADRAKANPTETNQVIAQNLEVLLQKAVWEENENFLRAKSEFTELKMNYLKAAVGNAELINKIRGVEFRVPDEIPGDMKEACEEQPKQAFYQSDKNYLSLCPALLSTGQSFIWTLDQKFSEFTQVKSQFSAVAEKRFPGSSAKSIKLRRNFFFANMASACESEDSLKAVVTETVQRTIACERN